jgi:hypothetical protein
MSFFERGELFLDAWVVGRVVICKTVSDYREIDSEGHAFCFL